MKTRPLPVSWEHIVSTNAQPPRLFRLVEQKITDMPAVTVPSSLAMMKLTALSLTNWLCDRLYLEREALWQGVATGKGGGAQAERAPGH